MRLGSEISSFRAEGTLLRDVLLSAARFLRAQSQSQIIRQLLPIHGEAVCDFAVGRRLGDPSFQISSMDDVHVPSSADQRMKWRAGCFACVLLAHISVRAKGLSNRL